MPLNRFRQMSTATVLRRVWPEAAILRALYAEGILSYNYCLNGPDRPDRLRDQLWLASPTRLPTHLTQPACVEQYLRSPPVAGIIPGHVTYIITHSRPPHGSRRVSRFVCLWEVAWAGDGTEEHFAFWSPSNAPAAAVAYATVMHTLFEIMAQALGFRSIRTFRVLSIAMPVAPRGGLGASGQ